MIGRPLCEVLKPPTPESLKRLRELQAKRPDLFPVLCVPTFAYTKPQPRQLMALPGGGWAIVNSETWW